jgi:transposase InsO family protein
LLQEYNFHIEYIKGEDNGVADFLSRCCTPVEGGELVDTEEQNLLSALLEPIVIPQEVYKLLGKVHNSMVGHFGVERTYARAMMVLDNPKGVDEDPSLMTGATNDFRQLREKVVEGSISMRSLVRHFVRNCPCCQKMALLKTPIHTVKFTTAAMAPMERINMDTISGFPADGNGNKYLIVIIDCFSRFVNLYPVKDTSAIEAAKVLLKFVGKFGQPEQLLSDNGTQFANEVIKELNSFLGTEFITTMPYSHQENGMVERANKEVVRHLRAIMFHKNLVHQWGDIYLLVERILNAEVHGTIGVSPAQILFGNAVSLERGVFCQRFRKGETTESLSDWMSNMLKAQNDILRIASETQQEHDMWHMARSDGRESEFPVNSYVLARYENEKHKAPTKFHTVLKGPFRVVNYVERNGRYTVQNLNTNKLEDYHLTNLQPFGFDDQRVDPRVIAQTDVLGDVTLYDVDAIEGHRPVKPKRATMLWFKVKWANGELTEEPWDNVRDNIVVHEYLRKVGWSKFIPQKYR